MIRHIIAFIILGSLIALLSFTYTNTEDLKYQKNIGMDQATGLAQDHPFIFWLVMNQVWIFIICVLLAAINITINYNKRGKFYHYIQKIYKEQHK